MLFVSDPNLGTGGQTMVTIDALGILLYAQLLLSVVLFLALQIMALIARGRFEQVGEWIVCRGTWIGIGIQAISMVTLYALVFYAQTDHSSVTYTIILIVANTIWFASLRLVFLLDEYLHSRQMRSVK
jgi:hypothetical protein